MVIRQVVWVAVGVMAVREWGCEVRTLRLYILVLMNFIDSTYHV